MFTYLTWWYGDALKTILKATEVYTKKTYDNFSISVLFATLFSPWKRDVVMVQNASLDVRYKVWLENLISIFIGFAVRLITIVTGLVLTMVIFAVFMIGLIIWALMPIVILFLIFNGIRVLTNG